MNYVIIKSDTRGRIANVGVAATKEKACAVLRKDFEKAFDEILGKKAKSSHARSFEELYAEYESRFCYLGSDTAWLHESARNAYHKWEVVKTATNDILMDPLTMGEMFALTTDCYHYLSGNVVIDLNDAIYGDSESFLDKLSEALTGSTLLTDISYKPIDVLENGDIVLEVSGDVSEILEINDDVLNELKRAVIAAGSEAIADFTGLDPADAQLQGSIDYVFADVMEKLPEKEIIRYCRKYIKVNGSR